MMAPALRTSPLKDMSGISLLKADSDLVIAGYASVEMVDKQGDLITRGALKHAFGDFMKADRFRNVQLAHSNIQVGEVIPDYTDSEGRVWKSGVDDAGMFVVIRLRDDIEKAREVANEVRKGNLRGFSIGGQAFKRMNKSDREHGDYTEISKLELHEVTICEKGINPEATFRILKEDTDMTTESENDVMGELSSVLDRLNKRLDETAKMEEEDKKTPPPLDEESSEDDDEEDDDDALPFPDKKNASMENENMTEKSDNEYSDVITSEYLNWMENTLKSAGYDTTGARTHFDNLEKANLGSSPKELDETALSGQVKGRAQEGGNPSTGAIGRMNSGKKKVEKADFLNPNAVSASEIEAAYEVYKAAALEQQFRASLDSVFADRLAKEQTAETEARAAASFDARAPVADIQKAIEALTERIENLPSSTGGEDATIRKSNDVSTVEIPSTADLANMDWGEVHSLAGSVWR